MAKATPNFIPGLLVEVLKDDDRKGLALTVKSFDGESVTVHNPAIPGESWTYAPDELEILF